MNVLLLFCVGNTDDTHTIKNKYDLFHKSGSSFLKFLGYKNDLDIFIEIAFQASSSFLY